MAGDWATKHGRRSSAHPSSAAHLTTNLAHYIYVYVWCGQTGILTAGLSLSLSLAECTCPTNQDDLWTDFKPTDHLGPHVPIINRLWPELIHSPAQPAAAAQHNTHTWPFFEPVVEKRLFYSIFSVWGRIS